MMNWNNNDTKYILKRIILYLLISCIVFFAGQKCAKAAVVSTFIDNYVVSNSGNTVTYENLTQSSEYFKANLTGYLVINLITDSSIPVKEVRIINYNSQFACSLGGSFISYGDANTQLTSYGLKCPVQFSSTAGLKTIRVEFIATNRDFNIWVSPLVTIVFEESDANQIISAQTQAASQQISAIQAASGNEIQATIDQTTAVQNAINNATQNQINAINSQTTAINDQTDYLKEDFTFDDDYFESLGLFGDDTNYIRQLLLWPFTFSLTLGQSLAGTTCVAYNFGSLYGTNIQLPCINWKNYVGNTIYTAIDIIMGMCILFGVITYIRKVFEFLFSFGGKAYETIGVEVFR